MRDIPSPQVAWKDYKKDHPDQFRTPVKDENEFNWNHMDMDENDHHRGRDEEGRGCVTNLMAGNLTVFFHRFV